MTIQYHKSGDYLIPNLVLPEEEQQPIGKYGRMRKRFQHLAEIDEACEERMELLTRQMAKQEGVTEALKASDQMEWVRHMNSIRNRAEEIVLSELVYC